jgi:hypothetical protein
LLRRLNTHAPLSFFFFLFFFIGRMHTHTVSQLNSTPRSKRAVETWEE